MCIFNLIHIFCGLDDFIVNRESKPQQLLDRLERTSEHPWSKTKQQLIDLPKKGDTELNRKLTERYRVAMEAMEGMDFETECCNNGHQWRHKNYEDLKAEKKEKKEEKEKEKKRMRSEVE